ncbi:hypothetical protein EON63_24080 [archaeon]|nr:MAG: hypothetical protein EON63_24080 [archaeon]
MHPYPLYHNTIPYTHTPYTSYHTHTDIHIIQVMRLDAPNSSLKPDDYEYEENVPFPPKGNPTPPHITPPHTLAHTFEFKTYSPRV